MTRKQTEEYITLTYNADPEHPWAPDTTHSVFRHSNNRKWFAVIMDIPRCRLGLEGDEVISVMNVKCDPMMSGSFLCERGIFPAYHMNKTHWLSIALDGSASDDHIKLLTDISFELTAKKIRKGRE